VFLFMFKAIFKLPFFLVSLAVFVTTTIVLMPRCSEAAATVINYSSVNQFDSLTSNQIVSASSTTFMLRRASVGGNVSDGLNALHDGDSKYNRVNFDFQDRGNPGWEAKLTDFTNEVVAQLNDFEVFSMKFCFIDYAADANSYISTMESLEASYPAKRFVWWTMPTDVADNIVAISNFNQTIRSYVSANDKILFDLASIESHQSDGTPCTSSGTENMCAGYTSDGGHLNATGEERAAKAFWVLIASLNSPIISSVNTSTSITTATITWITNKSASSTIVYGTTSAYGMASSSDVLETSHSITLRGLTSGAQYHFRVESTDASGNRATSTDYTFRTDNYDLGLHATSVEWLDDSHVRITYDWTDDNQLLDWLPTSGTTLTRSGSTINISGGATFVNSMKFSLPLAVSQITASANPYNSERHINFYTNLNSSWNGQTSWDPNPALGVVYRPYDGGSVWVVNGNTTNFVGVSNLSPNTWYDFIFKASSTGVSAWSSVDNTWYGYEGTLHPTTTGFFALGAFSAENRWEEVIIEGEVSPSFIQDIIAPVISSVATSSISSTAVTITWSTNKLASSTVSYGTTSACGLASSTDTLVVSHSIHLSGLIPNTQYHFRVESADASGNRATSTDYTFRTLAASSLDLHAKSVEWLDSTHIRVTYDWTSDDQLLDWTPTTGASLSRGATTTTIIGGSTEIHAMIWSQPILASSITAIANSLSTNHVNIYTNLSPLWTGAPWNANPSLGHIWRTTTDVWVYNGNVPEYSGPQVINNTWHQYEFQASETMLRAWSDLDNTWYERSGSYAPATSGIVALGAYSGNNSWGTVVIEGEIVPAFDIISPVISAVATSTTASTTTITWTTNESASSTVFYGLTSAYGSASSSDVLETSHSIVLRGLTSGSQYHFRVESTDASGNRATSSDLTFTPKADIIPPIISAIASSTTLTAAIISWTTNEPTNSVVNHGNSASYGSASSSGVMTTLHSIRLTGLTATTTYHFQISSTDASGNVATSADLILFTGNLLRSDEITFRTTGSSFSPILTVSNGATIQWIFADGSTSNSATPNKGYGSSAARLNRLKVTPWSALTEINVGYDAGDGGPGDITFLAQQNVTNVYGLNNAAPYLQRWSSNNNPITSLDFSDFISLTGIECFLCQQMSSVNLHNTPSLQRANFEDNNLSALDLSESPNLTDLRGANNAYTTINWGSTGDDIWHICVRDNPQISVNFPEATRYPLLQELFVWNDNQSGFLHTSSTHLTLVLAYGNNYTSADFSGGFPAGRNGQIDISHNSLTSLNITNNPGLINLNAHHNSLSRSVVDSILQTMNSYGTSGGTLDLTENSAPSTAGLAYASSLMSRGWTVNLTSDVVKPIISSIATSTTDSAATITWATDELATSTVRYGLTTSYGLASSSNSLATSSHSIILRGLTASTTYYFRVESADSSGNRATSSRYFLRTLATYSNNSTPSSGGGGGGATYIDRTAPVISMSNSTTTANSATIFWTTNELSNSVIEYGLTTIYNSTLSSPILTLNHSLNLFGLAADTIYHYRLKSTDASGNFVTSIDYVFRTAFFASSSAAEVIRNNQATSTIVNTNNNTSSVSGGRVTLVGVSSVETESITRLEVQNLLAQKQIIPLSEAEKIIYNKITSLAVRSLTQENKRTIADFIHNGTPTSIIIGAGERGGSLASFRSAFGRLPDNEVDWQDVIKIANGRWPKQKSATAEARAKIQFKKIYGREANFSNQNDNAAVTVMAYGLRPAQRNTNSEKTAIKSFKYFYKKAPVTAEEWDIVRAIAYSGARR
jgi:hypothetical protein